MSAYPVKDDDLRARLEGFFICTIEPERDPETGKVVEFASSAREKYPDRELNESGEGRFCRFRVPNGYTSPGVYFVLVDGELAYIGECEGLSTRFNSGYGRISPYNCLKRGQGHSPGQELNCRVNTLILMAVQGGRHVDLYFGKTPNRKEAEREFLAHYRPPWNRGGVPSA